MRTIVLNGWAAGPETWDLCTFERTATFDYLEQLDGLPERFLADADAAVLVGFSMGGCNALRLALAHPGKVKGLVLVSATARMTEDRATDWAGMSPRRTAALRFGTLLVNRGNPSPLFREDNLDRGLAFLRETDLRADLLAAARAAAPGVFDGRTPVAILQSARDGIVRPANAAFLKSVFPQATVRMIPGAEHVLPVTAPEAVDAAVAEVQVRRI